ncbi:hypothetical protein BACUNI_00548 [Bacteroides uniformis ATCC 8492]|uniref:Uncharacterized protein n=1 Tax=Bacteroides uniformis (strain ATCC 8492 / DSM 6597 / CCUG 4942 / CIP 103695 / JCM 5828 / KCTC 5204 / NCTC 13054 / VPI 0061) TaxID=411479 RepID=A0ABC9NGC0_BACUC|nr:hypothetical protein BACUNI_02990 [Bacteroides uniformis ATCC 8492]EDO55706.1 hypothetical protein BACUNI_00548 [Bacteroides uniformis ATCC 8492]
MKFNYLRTLYVEYDKLYALLVNRFFAVIHYLSGKML